MPRVRTATQDAILKNTREFAIWRELSATGDFTQEAMLAMAEKFGSTEKVSALGEDVSFEEFAAAFKKTGEAVTTADSVADGNCVGWAARDTTGKLSPYKFNRRQVGADEVAIKITYAGMCHSDIHSVRGEWPGSRYPMVPGHEIIGVVVEVGSKVEKLKVGDFAGIGYISGACRDCKMCKKNEEQYCKKSLMTYNSDDADGTITQGGYATSIVLNAHFALVLPPALHNAGGAPLLCAGVTTYSPMKHYGVDKPGMRVGVVGLGGLGHMAVKFAKAFGQHVTVISRSTAKYDDAINMLGADAFLVSKDKAAMAAAEGTFDAIIDTVSADHDISENMSLLDTDGTLILLGVPPSAYALPPFPLIFKRLTIGGSLVGGMKETQEMLDFCAEHNVLSEVEVVNADQANVAMDKMVDGDVRYRFVIDVQNSILTE